MICWYCYWNVWPKAVLGIYEKYENAIDDKLMVLDMDFNAPSWPQSGEFALEYGPGHIVWSDENFDSAKWCIDNFAAYLDSECPKDIADLIKKSLEELDALPGELKDAVPKEYKGENPENFPPDYELVRSKK